MNNPRHCAACGVLFYTVALAVQHRLRKHPEPVVVPPPSPPEESTS